MENAVSVIYKQREQFQLNKSLSIMYVRLDHVRDISSECITKIKNVRQLIYSREHRSRVLW